MLKIYGYIDPVLFLKDSLDLKREINSNFSLRSWAQSLGMKSHGPLHVMISGQRSIAKKHIPLKIKSDGSKKPYFLFR